MDSRSDSPSWLSDFLSPVPVDDFLSTYWRTRHLFCRGRSDRFAGLLSWPALNTILEHHWRETFRFRLALQGRDLEPASYADLDGYTPRIRARDVTDHLRRGATLSFDAIDELHEPLTRLAQAFEAFFRGGTKINIYAGWRALHGLDLHRDNQEIFILQLDGRKRWLVYGFSVDGIERGDLSRTSVPPPGAELDQVLQPGDLLYIPRGCYHLAVPIDEPTLHLTLGVKNPRGRDVWRWLVDRVGATSLADADLPLLADSRARIDFSERLRSVLLDGLDADLVEQYVADAGSNFKPRPSFSLPWSATAERLPPGHDFRVRLNVHRLVPGHVSAAGSFELRSAGRRYRFPGGMQWIVEQLADGSPMPIGALSAAVAAKVDGNMVRLLVAMLLKENLVSILT
ncbi:MAG TPA: cupin domain-containing protein [Vicinamibacterales bacterium]|jgi:ribosomal protein L16 Arg81 hydroxylase|nr:cupin domain-containing protein [Vicinamibacterales bacterium]